MAVKSTNVRLGIMMFLQFMVWGVWFISLGGYLGNLEFTGLEIGSVFGAFTLACLISPFIGGQIADRYLPTQVFMGIVHVLGGVLLVWLSYIDVYEKMWYVMFGYALLYAPTLALSNSICFDNLKDTQKEFGMIRSWGTVGWICAGLFLTFWWTWVQPVDWVSLNSLDGAEQTAQQAVFLANESALYWLAGCVSLVLGLYCFTLPNTPPTKDPENPFAFFGALKLLKDKNFAVFLLIAFVVSTELMFFYILTDPFLQSVGVERANVPGTITIFAQGAEMLTLLLVLPFVLPRLGIGKTLALGVLAWPIRYFIFCIGFPKWLVILSLTLHGICYVFFFVVAQIYVDSVAPKSIRASAQSLLTMVMFGLGLFVGSLFTGYVQGIFTYKLDEATGIVGYPELSAIPNLLFGYLRDNFSNLPAQEVLDQLVANGEAIINYRGLFLVPCVLTIICALAYIVFFREPEETQNNDEAVSEQ